MTVMVSAAFFDSGGLNAGTPLAIASTPVKRDGPAGERPEQQQDPDGLGARAARSPVSARNGSAVPVTSRKLPMATTARARPTNR